MLRTLGAAELCALSPTGERSVVFGAGKPLALIVRLDAAPKRSLSRKTLIDLLWANLDDDGAAASLRTTIWMVRKQLGDRAVTAAGDQRTLAASIASDRRDFEESIARGDFEAALELYSGEYLPDFASPGSAEFERWLGGERQRLKASFIHAGERAVERYLSSGQFRDATRVARRVCDADVDRESGWRLLLQSLLATGDTLAAVIAADAFEQMLATSDREPEALSQSVLRRVRANTVASPSAQPTEPQLIADLVGREREFSRLMAAWHEAAAGRCVHVHLSGAAGLGKTRLLHDFAVRLRAGGCAVVLARAQHGARDLDYHLTSEIVGALASRKGARGIARDAASTLIAINPAFSSLHEVERDTSTGVEASRRRLFAVRDLVHAVASERVIALLVDDFHWADAASRTVLVGAISGVADGGLLVVTASRAGSHEFPPSLQTREMALAPLSLEAVGELLASLATPPDDVVGEQLTLDLWRSTGGSALLVLETLHQLMDDGALVREDGAWQIRDSARIRSMLTEGEPLLRRIRSIPRDEAWLLSLLAVLDMPADVALLAHAIERDNATVRLRLNDLERRGLASQAGERWQCTHDEIAVASRASLTEGSHRAAAVAMSRALSAVGRPSIATCRRALTLSDAAHEEGGIAGIVSRYTRALREAGDHRPSPALVSDLLGSSASSSDVTRLLRTLPATERLGLFSRTRQLGAGATILVAMLMIVLAVTRPSTVLPKPDALLVVGMQTDSTTATFVDVPIVLSAWPTAEPLVANSSSHRRWRTPVRIASGLVPSFDGKLALYSRVVADSGDTEIFGIDSAGKERRLTFDPDDDSPSLGLYAPDGKHLVTTSDLWDGRGRYDLAIRDDRFKIVSRLTSGDAVDYFATWRSDGVAIAFTRQPREEGSDRLLCTIAPDGSRLKCVRPSIGTRIEPYAWSGASVLAVLHDSGGKIIAKVDPETGETLVLARVSRDSRGGVSVSRDGRWVACLCARTDLPAGNWYVFRVATPDHWRMIGTPDNAGRIVGVNWITPPPTTFLQTLRLDATLPRLHVGIPQRLRATGLDATGREVTVQAIVWSVEDSSIAQVEASTGELRALRTGSTTLHGNVAGWRSLTTTLDVSPPPPVRQVLAEEWSGDWTKRWQQLGLPLSDVRRTSSGLALHLNGDGNGASGVHAHGAFSTKNGLAIDLIVTAASDSAQWQWMTVKLRDDLSADSATWKPNAGELPDDGSARRCEVAIPGGRSGHATDDSLSLVAGKATSYLAAPRAMRSGTWHQVRLQLFADGRCGIAVNGRALAISHAPSGVRGSAQLSIVGQSMWTDIAVGNVSVKEGVPLDIRWDVLHDAHRTGKADAQQSSDAISHRVSGQRDSRLRRVGT